MEEDGRIGSKLLTRKYRHLAVPRVAASLAQTVVVLVDALVAGLFIGHDALAAIELVAPFLFLDEALHSLLGSGTSVQVVQAVGAGDRRKANRIIGAIMPTVLVVYAIVLTPCLAGAPTILTFWSDDQALISLTMHYLIPTLIAMPFFEAMLCLERAYLIDGRSLFFSIRPVVTSVGNIVLDIIFVVCFDFGISGLAIASILSTLVGYCVTLSHGLSRKCTIRPDFKAVLAPREAFSYIKVNLQRGGSQALRESLSGVAQASLCKALLMVGGTQTLAIWNVCSIGITVASSAALGLYNAGVLLVGFLFGEDDYTGVRIVFKEIMKMAVIVGAAGFVFEVTIVPLVCSLCGFEDTGECLLQVCAIAPFVIPMVLRQVLNSYALAIDRFAIAYVSSLAVTCPAIILPFAGMLGGVGGVIVGYLASELIVFVYYVIVIRKSGTNLLPVKGPLSLVEHSFDLHPDGLSRAAEEIRADLAEGEYGKKVASAAAHLVEECGIIIMGCDSERVLHMDTRIVAAKDSIKIVITDDGPPNNVAETILHAGEEYDVEAKLIRALASDISYDRILELNRLIICVSQEKNDGAGTATA